MMTFTMPDLSATHLDARPQVRALYVTADVVTTLAFAWGVGWAVLGGLSLLTLSTAGDDSEMLSMALIAHEAGKWIHTSWIVTLVLSLLYRRRWPEGRLKVLLFLTLALAAMAVAVSFCAFLAFAGRTGDDYLLEVIWTGAVEVAMTYFAVTAITIQYLVRGEVELPLIALVTAFSVASAGSLSRGPSIVMTVASAVASGALAVLTYFVTDRSQLWFSLAAAAIATCITAGGLLERAHAHQGHGRPDLQSLRSILAWFGLGVAARSILPWESFQLPWACQILVAIGFFVSAAKNVPTMTLAVLRWFWIGAALFSVGSWSHLARWSTKAASSAEPGAMESLSFPISMALVVFALFLAHAAVLTRPFRVVLFLRKFGDKALNQAIRAALRTSIDGTVYHLVTLDDGHFSPRGGRGWPAGLGTALLAGALYFTYLVVSRLLETVEMPGAEGRVYTIDALRMELLLQSAFVAAGLAASAVLFRWMYRASKVSRGALTREEHLDEVARMVSGADATLPLLTLPRAVVLKSSHELWERAVLRLLATSHVVILDVSQRTQPIEWELRQVERLRTSRQVVVTRRSNSAAEWSAATAVLEYDSVEDLRTMLRKQLAAGDG